MAKLNKMTATSGGSSPFGISGTAATEEGGAGFVYDQRTEAYMLGVTLMAGGEDTFYEKGKNRDKRFADLMESLAVSDPSWTYGFLNWLRSEGNIRTASIIGGAHAVHARLASAEALEEDEDVINNARPHTGINRALVSAVCQRADEPGEFAAYWKATFGSFPKPVKRGLGDAANALYSEYSVMKYDTASHGFRFADILNLTHVTPKFTPQQWELDKLDEDEAPDFFTSGNLNKVQLFMHIMNRRFGNAEESGFIPEMIANNMSLRKDAADGKYDTLLDADRVKAAGMTWEDVLSLAGSKLDKAKVWESVIPAMGYMALLRNLRNFEEAGISKQTRDYVIAILADPKKVAKSRQFPYRFMSAYENTNSEHYKSALSDALDYSIQNIPVLDGETLVLVDLSQSMQSRVSSKSVMTMAKQASLFGAAVAMRNPGSKLVAFATSDMPVSVPKGGSILKIATDMDEMSRTGRIGGGTETGMALSKHFSNQKRVIIFSDGQSFPVGPLRSAWYGGYNYSGYTRDLRSLVNDKTYLYGFDLAGYKVTDIPLDQKRTYQLGGLTDATFRMIPNLERGHTQSWPWLDK